MNTQVQMIVVSVNYRTTPIELREKLSFKQTELKEAMRALQQQSGIAENIIISTCNRTEIYAVMEEEIDGQHALKRFLADRCAIPIETIEQHLVLYKDNEAIEHAMRVSVGIDSMVIGETQILGQVRNSFLQGQSIGTTGTVLNQLFKVSITFSKRVHAKTRIAENPVSISYAAVQLLKQVVGDLSEQQVVVLGAGEMGELTLQNLVGNDVQNVSLLNRTLSSAKEMASRYRVSAKPFIELEEALLAATIVISSTAASKPIIQQAFIQKMMAKREGKALYIVDIAVPRDVDARVGEIPSVHLYDIDDIQKIVDANVSEREEIARKIARDIEREVTLFNEWLATLQVVPAITALEEKGERIQRQTLQSIFNKLPDLTERERKVLHTHTASIVNQLIRDPIQALKELAVVRDNEEELASFEKVLGIEKDMKKVSAKESIAKLAKERLYKK